MPANTCLDFIQDQQEAMTVAQCPDLDEAFCRKRSNAAFSLNRFDQDAGRLDAARGLQSLKIAKGHMVEPADRRPKSLQIFWLSARRDRRECPTVKPALKGQQPPTLRVSSDEMVASRRLDRRLERLRPRIAEKHPIRKSFRA
jgi:hypothetical protein